MITKDSIWKTHDGIKIVFKDLEDTHLANLIDWIKNVKVQPIGGYINIKSFKINS